MPKSEWTESQRVELCAHIVPLIQSGLPIDRGLKSMATDLPKRLVNISNAIQSRLENGEPLNSILASGTRPESRSLSATITAGEISGDLGVLIENWASLQTALALAKKRFRVKLVYPIFLILITVSAIGFSIHTLVPQYRSNLLSIHATVPNWFRTIEFVHLHLDHQHIFFHWRRWRVRSCAAIQWTFLRWSMASCRSGRRCSQSGRSWSKSKVTCRPRVTAGWSRCPATR